MTLVCRRPGSTSPGAHSLIGNVEGSLTLPLGSVSGPSRSPALRFTPEPSRRVARHARPAAKKHDVGPDRAGAGLSVDERTITLQARHDLAAASGQLLRDRV